MQSLITLIFIINVISQCRKIIFNRDTILLYKVLKHLSFILIKKHIKANGDYVRAHASTRFYFELALVQRRVH